MLIIQANKQKKRFLTSQKPFVPQVGIEPTTYGFSGRIDGYDVVESRLMPQLADLEADKVIAIFMNPKRIIHGNRKGIEIKRFDETTEGLEYGELFMRFRKRDGFLVTRPKKNMVLLKTAEE